MEFATESWEKLTSDNGWASYLFSADGKTAMFLKWKLDCHKTPVARELYSLDIQTHKLSLGYLLHPNRSQPPELSFGKAHVFYPEATAESSSAALLLEC